jgi:hypothetical protein
MGRGGRGGGGGRGRTSNDDRSDSRNPNNPAYQASVDNRANQLNPEHDTYYSSRGISRDDDDYDAYDDYSVGRVVDATKPVEVKKEKRAVQHFVPPTGEKASIKWSRVDQKYILTVSDKDILMLLGVGGHEVDELDDISTAVRVLRALGYEVEIEWAPV